MLAPPGSIDPCTAERGEAHISDLRRMVAVVAAEPDEGPAHGNFPGLQLAIQDRGGRLPDSAHRRPMHSDEVGLEGVPGLLARIGAHDEAALAFIVGVRTELGPAGPVDQLLRNHPLAALDMETDGL